MPQFDATRADCTVFTYKEGILSAIAHDLEIVVSQFHIEVDEQTLAIRATFASNSLRVRHAIEHGKPHPSLRDKDRREIEANIIKDVLKANQYPQIRFQSQEIHSTDANALLAYQVKGELELVGVRRTINFPIVRDDSKLVAEVRLHQPDFGIKPYRAALGALKIKPDVLVHVSVPWPNST